MGKVYDALKRAEELRTQRVHDAASGAATGFGVEGVVAAVARAGVGIRLLGSRAFTVIDGDGGLRRGGVVEELCLAGSELGVVAKTYGLPGLRIGWIATHNARILAQMAHLKDYTTICNSAPSEFLAELGLRHRGTLAQRNVAIITRNVALLDGFFARQVERCTWHRPKAGPIAFPRLLGEDVETFCHNLVMAEGVLLLPGTMYDDQENHFRIGFGRRNMPQAIGRLEQFLEENLELIIVILALRCILL